MLRFSSALSVVVVGFSHLIVGFDQKRKERKEMTNKHTHSTKKNANLVASNQFELSLLLNLKVTVLKVNF